MSGQARTDIPSWILAAGEKIQQRRQSIPRDWLINLLAGSSSPAYEQLEWQTVDEVVDYRTGDPVELPLAKGDPNASLLMVASRFKKMAAILGARATQMNEILEGHTREACAAVAYTYKGQTHAGVLTHKILDLYPAAHSPYYQAAIRMGRNDVPAGIGVWLPDENVLLRPSDCVVVRQNVPVKTLHLEYPGMRLV